MNKIIIIALFVLSTVACQQKDNLDTETKESIITPEPLIQEVTKYCTKELKTCPNGNSVSRNPNNNCEFDACSKTKEPNPRKVPLMCTADVKECPDGSYVGRDHHNNCKFKECPNGADIKDEI